MTTTPLHQRLGEIEGKKILIIGDMGLDEYVTGEVLRVSPEAPVPIVEVARESHGLGMSAFVAANVTKLGGHPVLVSAIGKDLAGDKMCELLKQAEVDPQYLIEDEERPTTRKLRVMAQDHHIVRVDYENRQFLSDKVVNQLLDRVKSLMTEVDGVIIQDYAKGVISRQIVEKTSEIAFQAGREVLVDPHRSTSLDTYAGVDLIKPNIDEALALVGVSHDELRRNQRSLEQVADSLMRQTRAKKLVITQGKDGMTVFEDGEISTVPTFSRQVFDVTGAGDAVIAALSLALGSGWKLQEACMLANFAAGVVVSKVGCVPCERQELIDYIQHHPLNQQ